MVGAEPLICTAKDGELVIEIDEMTESTTIEVFEQLATGLMSVR